MSFTASQCEGDSVWVATAAGGGRMNPRTGEWSYFNERTTPMYEIWTYGVSATPSKVYYAVWGGGVLEYDVKTGRWKDYNDPDGETEIVLYKDQGLIHEITTSVSYAEKDKILWVATYFGASRYDGRNWHNFLQKDSGLPSNFLNQVKAVDGSHAWFSTDKGLAYLRRRELGRIPHFAGQPQAGNLVRDAAGAVTRIRNGDRAGPQLRARRGLPGRRHLGRHRPRPEPRRSRGCRRAE